MKIRMLLLLEMLNVGLGKYLYTTWLIILGAFPSYLSPEYISSRPGS